MNILIVIIFGMGTLSHIFLWRICESAHVMIPFVDIIISCGNFIYILSSVVYMESIYLSSIK